MKEKFYLVIRYFIKKDDTNSHSVEVFHDYESARKRYYNIIASDLNNPDLIYNSVTMLDAYMNKVASDYFDRYQPDEPKANN